MLSIRARMLWAILVAQVHTLTELCMMMKEVWLYTVVNFKLPIRADFRPSSSTILKYRRLVQGKGGQLMGEAWSQPTTLLSRGLPARRGASSGCLTAAPRLRPGRRGRGPIAWCL